MPTEMSVGLSIGSTTEKNVRTGPQPSIDAASSISSGSDLMKPVNREKLYNVLDRAVEKLKLSERCLNLELSGEMMRIPVYEILYLDVNRNYVTIHADKDYTVKRTLAEFEAELGSGFSRIGRAMIVNLKHIRRVTKTELYLSNGVVLPLPRGAYEPLNRAIIANT